MLFGFELHQQRLDGLSTSDSIYETVLPRPNFRELLRVARSLLRDILVLDLQPLDRRLTYRRCGAHEMVGHWAKLGRPWSTAEPLEPSTR